MNGQKADMVFTDPPYGVDYKGINNDDRAGLKDLLNAAFSNYTINSKSGASVYCCHSDKCSDIFNEVFRNHCHFSCQIIWVKDTLVMGRGDYHSKHEPIFYGWILGGSHKFEGDRKQTSVWEFERPKRSECHSTMKPVGLVAKGISNSSKGEDLIFDLFLGSGTTMVAAHQLNRKCYGMELDPKYCQVIVDRMLALDPTIEIKRNGEKYIQNSKKAVNG
jgi:DNA modification methylase